MAAFPNRVASDVPQICIQNDDDMTSQFFNDGVYTQEPYFGVYSQSSSGASDYYSSSSSQSQGLFSSYDVNNSNQCLPPLDALDFGEPFMPAPTLNTEHFLTGLDIAFPYGAASPTPSSSGLYSPAEPSPAGSLLPHSSPASSYNGLSSPGSYYSDAVCLSDIESSSPVTPDEPNAFSLAGPLRRRSSASSSRPSLHHHTSSASAVPYPHFLGAPSASHHRSHSMSSLQRPRSVASQAMLDANSRRRRHPASFQCEICHQTFTALFSLKRHQQSHTGERPYQCQIPGCGQRFFNSSDCKRHEKSKKRHKDLAA